jgi:hypothetical protein
MNTYIIYINIYFVRMYFRLKYNLLSSHPSSSLHVSAVYGHHLVSIFQNYCTACQNYVPRVNTIILN